MAAPSPPAPNTLVIRRIDFADPENFMWSENVQEVAVRNGWWNPDGPGHAVPVLTPEHVPQLPQLCFYCAVFGRANCFSVIVCPK